ncbi:MAG: hypothetical protein ABSG91_15425 [Syntrophobacteraceae bacterium]
MRGADISVKFANVRHLPVEDVLSKAVAAARDAGADGANAALLSAAMLYIVGAKAQVGIPAGNRKLGAMARMIAKVDRCGIVAIPHSQDEQQDIRLSSGTGYLSGDGRGKT